MDENFDIESIFADLPADQARQLRAAIVNSVRDTVQNFKASNENKTLDEKQEEEIAALPRGLNNANQRRLVREKYSVLRNQPAPEVDEEIEQVKDDPRALMQLYKSRVAKIERTDPMKLHKRNEIASPFRKLGLNV